MPNRPLGNGQLEQMVLKIVSSERRDWRLGEIIERVQERAELTDRLEIRNAVIRLAARGQLQYTESLTIRIPDNASVPA